MSAFAAVAFITTAHWVKFFVAAYPDGQNLGSTRLKESLLALLFVLETLHEFNHI
jgi:hypothetical protein